MLISHIGTISLQFFQKAEEKEEERERENCSTIYILFALRSLDKQMLPGTK